MKKKLLSVLLLFILFGLCGCIEKYPDFEENYSAFQTSTFINANNSSDTYLSFNYNNRVYIPYGTGSFGRNDLDKCIGYIIQDENVTSVVDLDNQDTRVFTLSDDPLESYLMAYYVGTTEMNPPTFYRAIDTKNTNVETPKIIESLNYDFWK